MISVDLTLANDMKEKFRGSVIKYGVSDPIYV
jgi:hypothetical protein